MRSNDKYVFRLKPEEDYTIYASQLKLTAIEDQPWLIDILILNN